MNAKENSAILAGNVSLGNKFLSIVSALARCALLAKGSGARQKIATAHWRFFGVPWSLASTLLIPPTFTVRMSAKKLIAEALASLSKGILSSRLRVGGIVQDRISGTHDSSSAHLRAAVEGSLKRLRVDRIDLYQLHAPDPVVALEESVGTLAELQKEGKIRLVGLSNVTREHIERARKIVPIVSVQNRYSFADREWDYVVDHCEQNGIAFIPWFPLGAGRVAGEILDRVAKAHHRTPKQVALAWLLQRSPIMLPIPGTSSVRTSRRKYRRSFREIDIRGIRRTGRRSRAGRSAVILTAK